MGKKAIFMLIMILATALICSAHAEARSGIGISPGCFPISTDGGCAYDQIIQGSTKTFDIEVYNFDSDTKEFTVTISSQIKNVTSEPREFSLAQFTEGRCKGSIGCKQIKVTIDTSDTPLGEYEIVVKAGSKTSSGGVLDINQIVGARIMVNVTPEGHASPTSAMNYTPTAKVQPQPDGMQHDEIPDPEVDTPQFSKKKAAVLSALILIMIIAYKKRKNYLNTDSRRNNKR